MKKGKNLFFMIVIVVSATFVKNIYCLSDDAVVDSIKAYSNLTQADVDRWKLLWLGSAAGPTATIAGLYGMYKGYQVGKYFTPSQERLKTIFEHDIYLKIIRGYRPSQTLQDLATSNWTWAGASMIGAGVAAYKILRPRVQEGLLEKIKDYVALCERLAVTQRGYANEQQFKNALNQPGNTVWVVSGAFAQKYGIENLIEQANVALLLIDQLEPSIADELKTELANLRLKVVGFKQNAENNIKFIENDVRREQQLRAEKRSEYGKELDIQGKEVGVAVKRVKTLKNQWELLKDIGKTAKEYGPSILGSIGVLMGINSLKEWAYSPTVKIEKTGKYGSNKAWDQK